MTQSVRIGQGRSFWYVSQVPHRKALGDYAEETLHHILVYRLIES